MRVLVFQHLASETPGTLLPAMRATGARIETVALDEGAPIPPLEAFDAMLVMGGAMNVWDVEDHPWLIAEKRAIRRFVTELGRPYLGICLGHQLLADALGGTCGPMPRPEVGVMTVELSEAGRADPFLAGLPRHKTVLQWHGVRVAQPPEEAVVLAGSSSCRIEAMRVGHWAFGLQYHVEIEPAAVAAWAQVAAYRADLEASHGPGAMDRLLADTIRHADLFAGQAAQVWRNFDAIARAGTVED